MTRAPVRPGRRFGLRARVVFFVSGLVLLSWLSFALVLTPSMRTSFRHAQEEKISLYAELVSMDMDRTVTKALSELEAIARLPAVTRMRPEELTHELARFDQTSQFFLHFAVLDRYGKLIARPSKPERMGADRSDREYFVLARDQRRTIVAPVEISTAGNLSLVAGTPILGDSGELAGVLTGSIGLMDRNTELYQLITRPAQDDWPVEVILLSGDANVIASSAPIRGAPGASRRAGPTLDASALTPATDSADGLSTEIDGRRFIVSRALVPSTGWTVVVRVPENVVLAQVGALGRRATLIALVLLALVGVLGVLAAERFTRPLARLARALTSYGREGSSSDVVVGGSGEMRAALEAFNAMQHERTRAAAERERIANQMLHAQKLQTVGTLAGGIAHDFNNLLTPILLGSQRLVRDLKSDAVRGPIAEDIATSAELARDLVARILAFSRDSDSRRVPLAIAGVVEDAVRLVRVSLPRHIHLELAIDRSAGVVLADATQLHQVILNLCRNALDGMAGGSGTLGIELARRGPSSVSLIVSDTGAGMPPAVRDRVFEPFFTTKPPGQGTGLGLSVVHGIITQHEGSIVIDSEVGRGSRIQIELPIAPMAVAVPAPLAPAAGGPERILVVDDSLAVASAQGGALEQLGYRVEVATAPRDAVARGAVERFDLVVCDHAMPDLSGLQVTAAILAHHPAQRFLILSGSMDSDLRAAYATLGITHLASKPLSLTQLAEAIRAALA